MGFVKVSGNGLRETRGNSIGFIDALSELRVMPFTGSKAVASSFLVPGSRSCRAGRRTIMLTLEEAINSGDRTTIYLLRFGLIVVVLDRSSLRAPEDDDRVEANANLKTASRVLDHVYAESGRRYGDVVARPPLVRETRKSKSTTSSNS
ncbi:hypothetical protein AYO21_00438 [Fonsecaea monophora]|uniref:Uncharacterized protein n=1 Tax=Fonsecaea monophora TaxID=254056 RepID=A0A177FND4_9EURO|nr:hypothetical protein AYO21_00438 [Fonsecaea monophora]OAG45090.1 hypothetical protein AYO21_00438 [Fonsecaea monophora]